MTNNENKQYYIYLRSTKERIACTKEEFENYYRDIHAFRMKQQRRGNCVCPKKKELSCDMDCATCPFHRNTSYSLDVSVNDDNGDERTWLDILEDPSPLYADILADSERLRELFLKLNTLMPEAITIGKLREEGFTDSAENQPALRVIDPKLQQQECYVRFADHGATIEPEFIDFDGEVCLYGDGHGNLYQLDF